ncbi:hypothetical protein NDR87_30940 [Nocardia sp. CDC159]|uniref:Uncharacterized protein n=1 Tax=Nocardia pulmonis TaxID=2951408 RepID=A0A9X2EGZ6_9NOCA|nr:MULTISPECIES: hypothetical protein [Nocardia]MCM6778033.1 hypothetical protein [Nocardia pulmonis]MCM6790796.1 hypothetical protein [Nocardia sp. CDC159]
MIVSWKDSDGRQHWGAEDSKAYRKYREDNPDKPAEQADAKPEKPERTTATVVVTPDEAKSK